MTVLDKIATWVDVCGQSDLTPDRGVCALVGPYQVAIFRTSADDAIYALSNFDPFSRAYVLSRGIVGSKAGTPKVSSPIYKHGFDLRTGQCLDDPTVVIMTFAVRNTDGRIEVGLP